VSGESVSVSWNAAYTAHDCCRSSSTWVKVKDGLISGGRSVLLAMGHGNDQPHTVTSSTRHVTVQYLVTSASDVTGGLMASYVTLGTILPIIVIINVTCPTVGGHC